MLPREAIRMTRHRHGFHYYDSIRVPSLSATYIIKKVIDVRIQILGH
jgi:hypothetical protein